MKKRNADRYQMKPEEIAMAGSAIKDVLAAMDEISRHEYGENLNTAVRKGMRQPEAVRKYFDRNGGAAGIMASGLMDRALWIKRAGPFIIPGTEICGMRKMS